MDNFKSWKPKFRDHADNKFAKPKRLNDEIKDRLQRSWKRSHDLEKEPDTNIYHNLYKKVINHITNNK